MLKLTDPNRHELLSSTTKRKEDSFCNIKSVAENISLKLVCLDRKSETFSATPYKIMIITFCKEHFGADFLFLDAIFLWAFSSQLSKAVNRVAYWFFKAVNQSFMQGASFPSLIKSKS